jgi:hypothetical protein
MNFILVFTLAFWALFSPATWGQSCEPQIRDVASKADSGRVHRCLDERLNRLEFRMDAIISAKSAIAPTRNSTQFDAGPFSVHVRPAKRIKEGVIVGLVVRNKMAQEIQIALDESRGQILIDDVTGRNDVAVRTETVAHLVNSGYQEGEKNNYTLVPQGSDYVFSLLFRRFDGESASLNLNLFQFTKEGIRAKRIAVPLTLVVEN